MAAKNKKAEGVFKERLAACQTLKEIVAVAAETPREERNEAELKVEIDRVVDANRKK